MTNTGSVHDLAFGSVVLLCFGGLVSRGNAVAIGEYKGDILFSLYKSDDAGVEIRDNTPLAYSGIALWLRGAVWV
ncbi:MAG TPA: hypothetical protein VIM41_02575 [Gammaproteobacteria bacterium]